VMKFQAAALLGFLAAQNVSAFTPSTKPFGLRTQEFSFKLQSTTVKDEELFKGLDRNGVSLEKDINELIKPPQPPANTAAAALSREILEAQASKKAKNAAREYMKQYENQSGAAIVYSKLVEHGVEVVNGYSGGAVLPLLDQFHENNPRHEGKEPIRWITNSNESSAGHIAEGYAKSMPINGKHLPVGVAIATSGPGVTNLITPLQDGICDGVPMVVLCGQAATNAPEDAFQSAPAVEITKPCTKWSYQIKSAAEIPFVMDYAFFVARNGRPGPVFVDLPKDLQNQILSPDFIDAYVDNFIPDRQTDAIGMASLKTMTKSTGELFKALHLGNEQKGLLFDFAKDESGIQTLVPLQSKENIYNQDHHPTNRVIYASNALTGEPKTVTKEGDLNTENHVFGEMLEFIKRAKKPVILAGQGCNDSAEELQAFAEKLQIPVTTTLHALGTFDERHPLALNMVGMHGHPTPNFMVQEADLIINIGSRFDDRITGRMNSYVPEARKAAKLGVGGIIHVDIRLSEMAKQIEPTFFVHSTGKSFLQTMNAALEADENIVPQTADWLERKKELEKDYPITIPTYKTETQTFTDDEGNEQTVSRTRMSAQRVISEMDKQLLAADKMDDAIFTTGVGIHQMVAAQLITWTQPRQMLSSGSLGTMGVALGYVIGAKLANGKKLTIAIDGDGSFNMTFTELKTVAEQKIPIKIMILDNESQMMVEYWQRLFHDARYLAVRNSQNPDYCQLASAFGIKSIYVDSEDQLEEKMREFLFDDPEEPVLFHVRIERTPCLPLVAPGQPLDDMILEDVDIEVDKSAAPS
jgi:acetolactate synthase I/II/III large subunit